MAVADIDLLGARVVWTIGARDESSTFDRTTNDDRFDDEEIVRALIETESEVLRCLAESYHPSRIGFLEWSTDLAHGAVLPPHWGNIEAIEIKPFTASTEYVSGQSESRENIRQWRENHNKRFDTLDHNIFGSTLSGYFCLTNQTLEFTGASARARIFTYTPDYETPALQIEDIWDSVIVAGTIPKLHRIGVSSELINHYEAQFERAKQSIKQGLSVVPEVQILQKNDR